MIFRTMVGKKNFTMAISDIHILHTTKVITFKSVKPKTNSCVVILLITMAL